MEKTFEYRIYPNAFQRQIIAQTFGCSRWVYNHALGIRKVAYENQEKVPSINDCIKAIPKLKQDPETKWLKEADSMALQQSLRDLDKAYKNFFRNPGKVGFPKFKSKHNNRKSYRTNNVQIIGGKHVKLPKLGAVKARISRPIEGRILSATIKQVPSGKYFVTICCTDCIEAPLPNISAVVGIDLGSRKLITTSTGDIIDNPKYYRSAMKKLAREQRCLSRKRGARKGEKASNNYQKQKRCVAQVHEKIANQRRDFFHKLTTKLINENQVICAETLRVKNMVRNRKLAMTITDASWSEICRQLQYKAKWHGRTFVQVDAFFPSSQICHVCGEREPAVKDLREHWECKHCGIHHDRDTNAAKNILAEGLKTIGWDTPESSACGESVRPTAVYAAVG